MGGGGKGSLRGGLRTKDEHASITGMSLPLADLHGRKAAALQPLPGGPEGGLALARARLHEFCGPARVTLAAMLMGQCTGDVVWIMPGWQAERLYPDGLCAFADPGRLILARARRPEDMLWSMEESLRSGAVGLVICELAAAPGLTPVRRLHLAAEAGAEAARHRGRVPPLGVILTPGAGGAPGVETRWQLAPRPTRATGGANLPVWRLDRLRARMQPPAAWDLETGPGGKGHVARRAVEEEGGAAPIVP